MKFLVGVFVGSLISYGVAAYVLFKGLNHRAW